MHNGNHQNSKGCRFINGDIAPLYKQPRPFGDIRAGNPHFGMPGGKIEFVEEPVDKTIGSRLVVCGNRSLDIPQVILRARGEAIVRHAVNVPASSL